MGQVSSSISPLSEGMGGGKTAGLSGASAPLANLSLHRSTEEIELELTLWAGTPIRVRQSSASWGDWLTRRGPFRITVPRQSERLRANHPNRRVALEHVDGGVSSAGGPEEIEQQPSSPHPRPCRSCGRRRSHFLAVNLANIAVAIEFRPRSSSTMNGPRCPRSPRSTISISARG